LVLSAVCAVGVLGGQQLSGAADSALISLAASTIVAGTLTLAVILLRPQLLGEQTASMLLRFLPRLKTLLARALPAHGPEAFTPQRSEAT
jgi:lipopolysaccharide exporter